MEQEREAIFTRVVNSVVSVEKQATFEQGPVAPPTIDQILARNTIIGI